MKMRQDVKARVTGHFVKICDYYLYRDIAQKSTTQIMVF